MDRRLLRSRLLHVTRKVKLAKSCDRWKNEDKHIRDQVVPVLALLQTTKGHLCAGNVLFRVLEVGKLQDNRLISR